MGTKIEYVDSSHMYATNYIRNSKAIAVLWAIFSICYAIISVVAFVTPGKYLTTMHICSLLRSWVDVLYRLWVCARFVCLF